MFQKPLMQLISPLNYSEVLAEAIILQCDSYNLPQVKNNYFAGCFYRILLLSIRMPLLFMFLL